MTKNINFNGAFVSNIVTFTCNLDSPHNLFPFAACVVVSTEQVEVEQGLCVAHTLCRC